MSDNYAQTLARRVALYSSAPKREIRSFIGENNRIVLYVIVPPQNKTSLAIGTPLESDNLVGGYVIGQTAAGELVVSLTSFGLFNAQREAAEFEKYLQRTGHAV